MSDADLLALTELCNALADGRITEAERTELNRRLAESDEARRFYVRFASLGASLSGYAAEQQCEAAPAPRKVVKFPVKWTAGIAALAASIAAMLAYWKEDPAPGKPEPTSVAWLTGATDARWTDAAAAPEPGDAIERGQRLDLKSGLAEVTFDSGARVVLEGPASLDVASAWTADLRKGAITASAPQEAAGFRVENAAVQVTQLGGDVRIEADGSGNAEVLSLRGSAETSSRGAKLLLKDRQARRFARDGVSTVADVEAKFSRVSARAPINRKGRPVRFAHWSFNSMTGGNFMADTSGFEPAALRLERGSAKGADLFLHTGRWQRALTFDGLTFATGRLPASTPRLIATWLKIAPDAPLDEGEAILALGAKARGLRVAWNREPERGPLGALRTEHDGTTIIGSTSLRDGRWHHVAVMVVGNKKAGRPEVRQYVDGRLEGASIVARRFKANDSRDLVWIGRGDDRSKMATDNFRGELDELIIADRPLSPYELRTLIDTNAMPGA
jgi:ferric-dicitrate binding protein FerR (iron transport regulator)